MDPHLAAHASGDLSETVIFEVKGLKTLYELLDLGLGDCGLRSPTHQPHSWLDLGEALTARNPLIAAVISSGLDFP
jgi:hypothetical protein